MQSWTVTGRSSDGDLYDYTGPIIWAWPSPDHIGIEQGFVTHYIPVDEIIRIEQQEGIK